MQTRKHQLDHRRMLFRMQAYRNAAPVVFNRYAAVSVQNDFDCGAKARQRLVSRVIDDLLHNMQGIVGAGIHAWPLLDGLKSLQYPDGSFVVAWCSQNIVSNLLKRMRYFTESTAASKRKGEKCRFTTPVRAF